MSIEWRVHPHSTRLWTASMRQWAKRVELK
jgi:hypothetical protein